ncbi:MAG: acyl-ACP--UDP-N-acetylglucosamine O-acyltransferase [Limnochordales bacterium]|nr:acyl-ACP--UDP-N-acetylglucosamine O-acyltransferase [Limnochordales bacterium]
MQEVERRQAGEVLPVRIHPTAIVHPGAQLGRGVTIGPYAIVGEHVILGDETWVGPRAVVEGWTIVGRRNVIGAGAVIGNEPQDLKFKGEQTWLIIGDDNEIGDLVTISRGTAAGRGETRIGNRCRILAQAHVAHDCQLGNEVVVERGAGLSGHVEVEDLVIIGAHAGIHQFTRIGKGALVQAQAMVNKDVPPYVVVAGNIAHVVGQHLDGIRRAGLSHREAQDVQRAFELLYQAGLNVSQAIEQMEQELGGSPEIDHFIRFLRNAERGICR